MVSSVHTNSSAIAAVQALRSTADALDSAQTLMSTGFRVSTAADNAAYWSIATTMKSDNLTHSAVHDGLGLSAAIVDTAYTGLMDTLSVLDKIKSKIVSAYQPGIDRSKIQSEIGQLIRHAKDTARASSFGGTNWLYTTESHNLLLSEPLRAEILSSVSREADMSLSIGAIGFNRTPISLLNDGGGGLLQKEPWALGTLGGFRDVHINTTSHNGHEDYRFTGPTTFGVTDSVSFNLTVDSGIYSSGETYNVTIDRALVDVALGTSDGVVGSADDLRSVLESYFTSFGIPATTNSHWAGATPTNFEIGSLETSGHAGSSIVISNVISTFPGNFAMGFENSPDILDHDNMYPQGTLSFDGPFSIGPRATVTFDVEVGTSGRRTVVIDQSSVSQALGTYGGEVNTADELAQVIQFVAGPAGLHVTANGVNIEFAADRLAYPDAGNRAANVYLGNVQFNEGGVLDFDLDEVDIAIPGSDLDRYLRGIDLMIERVVDAGSMIGSLQTRIDIQRSFTDYLIDGTRKGISRLIDADMTEASSRLKAFQAQHELALQSLSLANAGSRVLLQLFDA